MLSKRFVKIIIKLIILCVIIKGLFVFSLLIFPLPDIINNEFSKTYYYSDKTLAWVSLNSESQYRIKQKISTMNLYIKKGVVKCEDQYFYFHPGFNCISIIRALFQNITGKRIVSGGSTITMQLARIIEPKKRTLLNKLIEVFRSMQIEAVYSKDRILEMYLNLIPMGGNIQGVGAASYLYFGKPSEKLTFSESCMLLSLSNSPVGNNPDKNIIKAMTSRNKTATRIYKDFNISFTDLRNILSNEIYTKKFSFNPDIIPLIERLSKLPEKSERILTIDKKLQALCLSILKDKMSLSENLNGALIVVDNNSMKIKAYIGSPFYDSSGNGVKYNAANILRSPGSTLKPFIYANALSEGIITKKKKLYDIPSDFSGYTPQNFSNFYTGVVSADEALYRSLNIPAIYLEEKLGDRGLKIILNDTGLTNFNKRLGKDDLSAVLGSFPLTLENLTELYTILANKGLFKKLVFFEGNDKNNSEGKRVISEESAYIIDEMLSEGFRPDLNASWEFSMDKPKVAFKTGTSYGFIDGWCIGVTKKYTIGVWIGNLDNKFTKTITGSISASPVLFKIVNELERENDSWFVKPENVLKRKVCSVSGELPGKFCERTEDDLYLKEISGTKICDIHKRVFIDKKTKNIIQIEKLNKESSYEEKTIEIWNPEVEAFLSKTGRSKISDNGSFKDILSSNDLTITSPDKNALYTIFSDNIKYQKLPLTALAFPDSKKLYWYVNDRYVGSVLPDKTLFFTPDEKVLQIYVVDEIGRTDFVKIDVKFLKN